MKPLIFVNFKAYENAFGKKGEEVAKAIEKVVKKFKVKVFLMVPNTEIYRLSKKTKLPIFSQGVDAIDYGAHTGHIPLEAVKEAGAYGILLNHSENRINLKEIKFIVEKSKKLKLKSLICVENVKEGKAVAKINPDFIALEEKSLISSGKSISEEKPELIKDFVKEVKKVNKKTILLCGAGISTKKDVVAALKLGTKGVLLASAVMKANNPGKAIEELIK